MKYCKVEHCTVFFWRTLKCSTISTRGPPNLIGVRLISYQTAIRHASVVAMQLFVEAARVNELGLKVEETSNAKLRMSPRGASGLLIRPLSLSSLPTTDVDKLGCFQNIHSPPFIYLQSFLSLPCIICVAMENTGQSAILYSERQWTFC